MNSSGYTCELCDSSAEVVLWRTSFCRVVRVPDPCYSGFCRVIWVAHVREMTDLSPKERIFLMNVVFAVEEVIRCLFKPDKINLASLGNVVAHLHWHIIPRWQDDTHFPQPIWGAVQRDGKSGRPEIDDATLGRALGAALAKLDMDGIFHEQ